MRTRKPAFVAFAILALFTASLPIGNARAQQPAAAPAAPLTFEERLAKLEAEVGALRQENQQLRNQIGVVAARASAAASTDASVAPSVVVTQTAKSATPPATPPASAFAPTPLPAASPAFSLIKPGGGEQWISVGGFIMAQAEAGDAIDTRFSANTSNDRFYLRRARIVLGGHFAENFDFKISAEMAGPLARTDGMRGQLADGYISWTKYPALNVTMGQFKTGYGHEFLANDLTVYTIEHALVSDVLTLGRQIGAQASGTFLKNRLNYTFGVFNGNGVNTSANDNDDFLGAGRVTFTPVKTKIASNNWDAIWNIGINGYTSKDASITLPDGLSSAAFPGRRTGWGVDTQLTIGPWALWFEYLGTEFDPAAASLAKINSEGWFLQGAWNIVPKKWQAVIRYDAFDPNTDIAGNLTRTWTLGVNYLIKGDDLKLMLDYMTSDPRFRANSYQSEDRASRVLFRMQAAF